MIKSKIFVYIAVTTFLLIIFYSLYTPKSSNPANAPLGIMEWRSQKDQSFLRDAESPLTEEQKSMFKGLNYFPVDPEFSVIADWRPLDPSDSITLIDTKGGSRTYFRSGIASFEFNNVPCELTVLHPIDMEDETYLFIPFFDETSAISTYGGGRYVEPELLENGRILIDFNRAYNPYCVYNKDYRCPIPPLENQINVSIRAGEKKIRFLNSKCC